MLMQSMNHQQALETMAVERYVLLEMSERERGTFEQHFLDCPQCLEAVTAASDFFEVGRDFVLKRSETPALVSSRAEPDRLPFWSLWLRPLPALGIAVFLGVAAIAAYQQIALQNALEVSRTPKVVTASVFLRNAAQNGENSGQSLSVARMGSFLLDFDLPNHPQFASYEGHVVNNDGTAALPSFSLPAEQIDRSSRMELSVPSLPQAGPYQLIILGVDNSANEKIEIARYPFLLQFTN